MADFIRNLAETYLYPTSLPPYPRDRPMRVLAVGMSRSGTESLQRALHMLGYSHAYHGFTVASTPGSYEAWVRLARRKYRNDTGNPDINTEELDRMLWNCQAITDFPAASMAPELLAAYPDAKVILNVRRDVDAWYTSMKNTMNVTTSDRWAWFKSFFSAELYWRQRVFQEWFAPFWHGSSLSTGKWRYRDHANMVRGMVPKEKLLEWSVEDGWEPLATFLGVEAPKEEFPKGNTPQAFMEKIKKVHIDNERVARRNMALTAAVVAAAIAGGVRL